MYYKFEPNTNFHVHIFPDYYTQGNKIMRDGVVLEGLLQAEYNYPLHPYIVVCQENYHGTQLNAELFDTWQYMITNFDYRYDEINFNDKKYFYCEIDELIKWVASNISLSYRERYGNSSKQSRIVNRLHEEISNLIVNEQFYTKNFVNAGQTFYHIYEVAKLFDFNDKNLWYKISRFAEYVALNIRYIPYINPNIEEPKLLDIIKHSTNIL